MTIGQRVFHLLDEKNMTQREFSKRTGIATTTISDWRKKNTNPGSDKIMCICAALEVTPEYLLAGVTEDSERGRNVDFMVIPGGTKERELMEVFNDMDWMDREHLLEYARNLKRKKEDNAWRMKDKSDSIEKIAEFCNIEVFINTDFVGEPSLVLHYLDEDVDGTIDLTSGKIEGDFSKYVRPVIEDWLGDNKGHLLRMWRNRKIEMLPKWE